MSSEDELASDSVPLEDVTPEPPEGRHWICPKCGAKIESATPNPTCPVCGATVNREV